MEIIINILHIFFYYLGCLCFLAYLEDRQTKTINKDQVSMKVFQDIYDSINFAIKNNHPKLVYCVEHLSIEDFMMLYKGIEKNYPFLKMTIKTNLEKKSNQNPNGTEYLEFDLESYQGPRNVPLTVRLEPYIPLNKRKEHLPRYDYKRTRRIQRHNLQSQSTNNSENNVIYLQGFRNKNSQLSMIQNNENQGNVINFQDFKNKKKIQSFSK